MWVVGVLLTETRAGSTVLLSQTLATSSLMAHLSASCFQLPPLCPLASCSLHRADLKHAVAVSPLGSTETTSPTDARRLHGQCAWTVYMDSVHELGPPEVPRVRRLAPVSCPTLPLSSWTRTLGCVTPAGGTQGSGKTLLSYVETYVVYPKG